MIEVTVGELVALSPALKRVMEVKLPVKAAYRLSRIAAKFTPEIRTFEEARLSIFQELGTEVEKKPGFFEIKDPEKREDMIERVEALYKEKVKVDAEPVPLDMLGTAELSAADLLALEKIIV